MIMVHVFTVERFWRAADTTVMREEITWQQVPEGDHPLASEVPAQFHRGAEPESPNSYVPALIINPSSEIDTDSDDLAHYNDLPLRDGASWATRAEWEPYNVVLLLSQGETLESLGLPEDYALPEPLYSIDGVDCTRSEYDAELARSAAVARRAERKELRKLAKAIAELNDEGEDT